MLKRGNAHDVRSAVEFKKPRPGEMPHYQLPDTELCHGASLANKKIWVNTKATGAVERVFCNAAGRNLLGSITVTYAIPTKVLITSSPEPHCLEDGGPTYVLAAQEGPGIVKVFPFRQKHIFDLSGELHVDETVLVPKLAEEEPPAVLHRIEVTNMSGSRASLLVTVYADLQGDLGDDLVVEFDEHLSALIVHNESQPNFARIVGAEGCGIAFRTTHDVSESYAGAAARKLDSGHHVSPGRIGQLQMELEVEAGETVGTTIVAVVSNQGVADARSWFARSENFSEMSRGTVAFLTPAASLSMVETPDPIINQGVFWAKVNMLKVAADYPEGPAFTNEPGVSSNVVGRDVAWFVYGSDFLDPKFSRQMLLKLAEKQYESGKIPEYYNALDGRVEDYGISVNDDTPLFILACCHHYATTNNEQFLDTVYPNVRKAAEYLLGRRDEGGLVISKADGYEVYGIASWRNVIPGYQINGAVTEINAECYAALKRAAGMAEAAGHAEDAERFDIEAEKLKSAINRTLLNPQNGVYFLNIDSSGQAQTDVTADQIFPVLFGVAPPEVERRIVSRLRAEDFMTSAGLRTVSRNSPDYEPTRLVGLCGGVWPGVAFWYAFAAMRTSPEFMVDALHASYLQYLKDPLKNNTVPGQFSEWFDGESLVNRGMRLSPWEPPRLLWAAVEGLCGARPGDDGYTVAPARPPDWEWLALRRVPCKEGFLTYFAAFLDGEVHIYSNRQVNTPHQLHVAGEDVTNRVRVRDYRVHRAVFAADGDLVICVGSEASLYLTALLELPNLLDPSQSYRMRVYGRDTGWLDLGTRPGKDFSEIAVSINDGGFRIITISQE